MFGAKIIVAGQSGPGWNDRVNLFVHPDVFVALTKSQALWAKKATIWNNQKIVVIPNGVDLEKFTPKGDKYKHGLKGPIVLAVGAAIKSKRIKDTIRAVSNIKDVSLVVAGTGPLEKKEDKLGKKLLGSRYTRIKVSHQEMPKLFRSADVFTLCSDSSEAFGIVYLEALATGLPCVVTYDASRQEILGEAGIFVKNPEDAKEYSAKIIEALKQRSSVEYLKQANKYSWGKISTSYKKAIKMISEKVD